MLTESIMNTNTLFTVILCIIHYSDHKELLAELQSLSVTADTLRVRTRRAELENKLTEIDDALKIFSRPNVYIKLDS